MITILTQNGVNLLAEVIGNEGVLEFVRVEFGSGQWVTADETVLNNDVKESIALRNRIPELDMLYNSGSQEVVDGHIVIDAENKMVKLSAEFSNSQIEESFHITEIGYYAQNLAAETPEPVLFAISVTDWSKAIYVPARDEDVATFNVENYIYVGDVAQVSAAINEANDTASRTEFLDHVNKRNNPHETTKEHVGLGKVPNVTTNEQAPTFKQAPELVNIDGDENPYDPKNVEGEPIRGKETISVILGKVKKAIDALIRHVENVHDKNLAKRAGNPHGTTADDVGAASSKHYHNAKTDISGILPISNGGTGHSKKAEFDDSTQKNNSADCVVQYGCAYIPGDDGNVVLVQWGWLNCDSESITVTLKKPYPNDRYVVDFPTCGRRIVPIWRNPELTRTGFTMNRSFGIDSSKLKTVLKWIGNTVFATDRDKREEFANFVDNRIGASQSAFWITIGKTAK